MKSQRGYYMSGSGFTGCLIVSGLLAAVAGGWVFYVALPWAWERIKPLIHAVTT